MKIIDVVIEKRRVMLRKPFRISLGVIDEYYALLLKIITDEGITGIGEGAPFGIITGENIDGTIEAARLFRQNIIGADPCEIGKINIMLDRLIYGNPSAKAAYDMAIYDINAKMQGLPLYKYLGGKTNTIDNDITITIDDLDTMISEAVHYTDRGFTKLKIKVGGNEKDDINNIKRIRETVGDGISIHIDANQAWDVDTTLKMMKELKKFNISSLEQPVPRWDVEGLAEIRKRIDTPLIADESVFNRFDAMNVIKNQAADYINIKLMKCGGIYQAIQINALAEKANVKCMVGCMMDTAIAITAAASFVASCGNVCIVDLDSVFQIHDSVMSGIRFEGQKIILSDKPGMDVDF